MRPLLSLLSSLFCTVLAAKDSTYSFKVTKPSSVTEKKASAVVEERIFQVCEQMPQFPGEMKRCFDSFVLI